MDEPTDLMREGEVMGSLSLNEANIRNSQRLRRRTSSASSRSQSESPVKSGNLIYIQYPIIYLSLVLFKLYVQ